MIRRVDRMATALPPPSEPDPAGAAAVQELMGGRFGEMSTFLNYTESSRKCACGSRPPSPTVRDAPNDQERV